MDSVFPLHDAVRNGDLEKIKALLIENPDLVSSRDSGGATPLHVAASLGNLSIAELLLGNGADPNAPDNSGKTPLNVAEENGFTTLSGVLSTGDGPRATVGGEGVARASADQAAPAAGGEPPRVYGAPATPYTGYAMPQLNPGLAPEPNTSGMGPNAVLPPNLRGFNWGAFFLGFIWSIANKTWIGLLCLVPCAGLIMHFVLGFKGNEWAWRNRQFQSVEQFKIVQRTWAIAGLAVFCCFGFVPIVSAILFPVFAQAREKARETECISNMKQIGLGLAQYSEDWDEKFPSGTNGTQDVAGWPAQVYPYIKSVGVMKCPDDATAPSGGNVPISYGMNSNAQAQDMAAFPRPNLTVLAFEVSGVVGNPTSLQDTGGASGNGSDLAPGAPSSTEQAGALVAGDGSSPRYETGVMNGVPNPPANGAYDMTDSGGGLHMGGADYLFADFHAKWCLPSSIYAGANNPDTGTGICTGDAGAAANTGCTANGFAGTFSVN